MALLFSMLEVVHFYTPRRGKENLNVAGNLRKFRVVDSVVGSYPRKA